jgi:cell division protein FtsL
MSNAQAPAPAPASGGKNDPRALAIAVMAIGLTAFLMITVFTRADTLESELRDLRTKVEQNQTSLGTSLSRLQQEAAELRDQLGPAPGALVFPPRLGPPTMRDRLNQLEQRLSEQEKKIKDLEAQLAKFKDKGKP